MSTNNAQSPGDGPDADLIRAILGKGAPPQPGRESGREPGQEPGRKPRTNTRLLDPALVPDLAAPKAAEAPQEPPAPDEAMAPSGAVAPDEAVAPSGAVRPARPAKPSKPALRPAGAGDARPPRAVAGPSESAGDGADVQAAAKASEGAGETTLGADSQAMAAHGAGDGADDGASDGTTGGASDEADHPATGAAPEAAGGAAQGDAPRPTGGDAKAAPRGRPEVLVLTDPVAAASRASRSGPEPEPEGGLGWLATLPRSESGTARHRALLTQAMGGFARLAGRLAKLEETARQLAADANRQVAGEARRLQHRLAEFEPSVVMIGQVKAGKTSLVNAMIGKPAMLPADVNPWTSVVTSIHMTPPHRTQAERASFRFFDEQAWTNLVQRGGRVGELANRAGANEELERVRAQLAEMRDRSRERLGRRFEMLMGQTHDYDEYDAALVERYVCLGDDFWERNDTSRQRGRFADITRSADLWVNRPELPMNLCIRDTPGVNDTFMIREQITLGAIRGSKLCVVVLSAMQALSTVDLGLIRLISNLKSRDIVIFVNRIDELGNPAAAVPQIRASIEETLARYEVPKGVRIIFGSGHWAGQAFEAEPGGIGADSADALMRYAAAHPGPEGETADALQWRLSGLPELYGVLAERVASGVGEAIEAQIDTGLRNLKRSQEAMRHAAGQGGQAGSASQRSGQISGQSSGQNPGQISGRISVRAPDAAAAADLGRRIERLEHEAVTALTAQLCDARNGFGSRVGRARHAFIGRATAALLQHLEQHGEAVVWTYDPVGLRTLLRSAFQVHQRDMIRIGQEMFERAARDLSRILSAAYGMAETEALVVAPPLPEAPPPLALGQTIALDLKGSWWNRFWRRTRGYEAFAESFSKLIEEETTPIIDALCRDTAERFEAEIRATLIDFLQSQRRVLSGPDSLPPDPVEPPRRQT